jgi:hypothetical protein
MSYSEDGQFFWNGTDWIPADQAPGAESAPAAESVAAEAVGEAAPAPAAAAPIAQASGDPRYDHNELEVKQRLRSLFKFGQQYDIYTPGADEAAGYAHRPFNLPFMKCDLVVYTDQTQQTELLRAKQSNGFDGWGSFDIMDSQTGEHISTFKRQFWAGIFQRKWLVTHPDGTPHFQIQEDSLLKSLVRRFGGGLFPPIAIILRTNMNFRTIDGQTDFGSFNRKFSLRDRYQLQRASAELDGRLLWVTGPLLDNAGGR